ncbi:hypothetical protein J6A34_07635, partial [bacterium]|nr:hypothetical protein [bacterium]
MTKQKTMCYSKLEVLIMGFRTSKFMTGMKSKKAFKTISVAALAGITSMGMAQAQSPEVIMAPIPQVGNEFGDVNNQSTEFYPLEKIDILGKTWVMDGRYLDLVESRGELPQEYLDALNRQEYLKYYYDQTENSIKVKNYYYDKENKDHSLVFDDIEITQDFMEDHIEGGSSGIALVVLRPDSIGDNIVATNYGNPHAGFYHFNPDGYVEEVSASFINEYAVSGGGSGGFDVSTTMESVKILNEGEIGTIDATIVGTYGVAGGSGGFAFEPIVENNGLVDTLRADFVANAGSAILNTGTIGEVNVDVIGNGTANFNIVNSVGLQQGDIVISGPQVINFGKIEKGIINSNFINNENHFYVYNEEVKTNETKLFDKDWDYLNENFQGGTTLLEQHMLATPPAIFTMTDLTVGAENGGISVFSGNKGVVYDYSQIDRQQMQQNQYNIENVSKLGETTDAIFVMPNIYASQAEAVQSEPLEKTTLTLSAKTDGKLVMNDNINGFHYNLDVTGDETGVVYLNNNVKSYDIDIETGYINSDKGIVDVSLEKTNLILGRGADVLDGHNLTLNSGALSMLNGEIGQMSLNQLNVAGDTKFYGDVDLANAQMDRVTADEYAGDAKIVVSGLNLLSDAKTDTTEILFADYELKDNVRSDVTTTENNLYQSTAYSPIFKYDVKYSEKEDGGYFEFAKHVNPSGGGTGTSDSFNPAVLGSSTSATVGAVGTINQTLNHVFNNADTYMNIPYLERVSMRDRNKYALSLTGDATDVGRYSPLFQPAAEQGGVWVKPYATFETVGLKNGPKVHNNTYGTLIGFDTEMQSIKRGWDRVFTGYIGYNGASQRYSGIDSTQNGGLIGGTVTMYKGNFFNATTVSVGASVANNQTMYGNEDFAMLLS